MVDKGKSWWQHAPPKTLEQWVTLVKHVVEIVAIFVAATWTYTTFIRTEEPAHGRNFIVDQQMEWSDSPEASVCYGILDITLQNVSKSEVRIDKVIQRAWILPLPSFTQRVAFIDPEKLSQAPADDSVSYTSGSFVQDYPPSAKVRNDLVWTMRRGPGIALFRVDFFADSTEMEPTDWMYDWDEVCGGEPRTKD